jgi:hypothetical protein
MEENPYQSPDCESDAGAPSSLRYFGLAWLLLFVAFVAFGMSPTLKSGMLSVREARIASICDGIAQLSLLGSLGCGIIWLRPLARRLWLWIRV